MQFEHVSIVSLAHVDPAERWTSAALDDRLAPAYERLGLRAGMLEGLSGIVARRVWPAGTEASAAAVPAAELALARADIDVARIGLHINTAVSRDWLEPSTACMVHAALGLPATCVNFDIANACLGFLNAMEVAATMIEQGSIDYALITDGENSRPLIDNTIGRLLDDSATEADFRSQFASLTLGSASVAMVLGRSDLGHERRRFKGVTHLAATEHNGLCRGRYDDMRTDTRPLLVEGLRLTAATWARACKERGWSIGDFDHFAIHQVSRVHTESFCETIGADIERCTAIYEEYGNVGPAGVPTVLSKAVEAGAVSDGDRVGLMGIGSGLNCAMGEVIW